MADVLACGTLWLLILRPWVYASVLLGITLGSSQPMVMSTLHQITPAACHGEALGFRLMAINMCSVVMPMLFCTLGAVVSVQVVFGLLAWW